MNIEHCAYLVLIATNEKSILIIVEKWHSLHNVIGQGKLCAITKTRPEILNISRVLTVKGTTNTSQPTTRRNKCDDQTDQNKNIECACLMLLLYILQTSGE